MTRMRSTVLAGFFAVALSVPAALQADPVRDPDLQRAQLLKAKAESLYSQPKAWKKVARLLEQSAALRAADDAEAFNCLWYAGRIRGTLGDAKGARRLLEMAAAQALARGAVSDAAEAYVDAAYAAKAQGDREGVVAYMEKAKLLASSPLLSQKARSDILARVS